MASKKYRSYGVRRENNLSDLDNKEEGLNNLLNNLPGVGDGLTFISEDLDAIRGLKDTSIEPTNFLGLAGSTPKATRTDEFGNAVLDINRNPSEQIIKPIYRVEDRFKIYRTVTEFPPVFNSGSGPYAYFMPSTILPTLAKGNNLNDVNIDTLKVSTSVEKSDDYWALGEFIISDKIRTNYRNKFGGILWEGYYIPNPSASNHFFSYETTGLFHVEYDRFGDNNWVVAKSIYAKVRQVTVSPEDAAVNTTSIQLALGESRYISVGDFIFGSPENIITAIAGDLITLTNPISATINSTLSFDMNLGNDRYSSAYNINEILDKGETPQIKKRIFWWFPFPSTPSTSYVPDVKYLRNIAAIVNGSIAVYPYYYWNKESASPPPGAAGSIRDLLEKAITPSQPNMGSLLNSLVPSSGPRKFKTSNNTNTLYTPKSSFAQINKVSTTISFKANGRYIQGTLEGVLDTTEIGNVIVPQTPGDLNTIIPKNLKIKDTVGIDSPTIRTVNLPLIVTQSLPVHIIDHLGLVDYFVATSTANTVTVSSTTNLKVDMICVTATTTDTAFVRITGILSPTQFTTSAPLALTAGYVFIYSNSGILDRSMEVFCAGVFGKKLSVAVPLAAAATTNTLQFANTTGIALGQKVQFAGSIATTAVVTNVNTNTNIVTISTPLIGPLIVGATIVFAPAITTTNKEICVLPLDLSPPFEGVDTGLDTDEKSIKGTKPTLNVKIDRLTINNATVNTSTSENYDRKIAIANDTFSIIAKLVI